MVLSCKTEQNGGTPFGPFRDQVRSMSVLMDMHLAARIRIQVFQAPTQVCAFGSAIVLASLMATRFPAATGLVWYLGTLYVRSDGLQIVLAGTWCQRMLGVPRLPPLPPNIAFLLVPFRPELDKLIWYMFQSS